jgi:hypothetical protein
MEHNTNTIGIFLAGWSRLIAAQISKILPTSESFFTKRLDQSLHSTFFTVNSSKEDVINSLLFLDEIYRFHIGLSRDRTATFTNRLPYLKVFCEDLARQNTVALYPSYGEGFGVVAYRFQPSPWCPKTAI